MFKVMLATAIIFVAATIANAETPIRITFGDVTFRCPPADTNLKPDWVERAMQQGRVYSLLGMPKPTWLIEQIKMAARCGLTQ
jgi:hypothetical protein